MKAPYDGLGYLKIFSEKTSQCLPKLASNLINIFISLIQLTFFVEQGWWSSKLGKTSLSQLLFRAVRYFVPCDIFGVNFESHCSSDATLI